MIRITVELVPRGIGTPQRIAKAEIINDGTGTLTRGNYRIRLWRKRLVPWREFRVKNFARRQLSVWHLLADALQSLQNGSTVTEAMPGGGLHTGEPAPVAVKGKCAIPTGSSNNN